MVGRGEPYRSASVDIERHELKAVARVSLVRFQGAVLDSKDYSSIVEGLPRGRTLFHYFKDRYALMLLGDAANRGCSVATLKSTRFRSLLKKPLVRKVLSSSTGQLNRHDFQAFWVEPYVTFRLSVGQWPPKGQRWCRWSHQMARPGCNLVLQLNLCRSHVRKLEDMLGLTRDDLLGWNGHPIAAAPEFTLSWARIDYDAERKEALIEEIQSDWIRDVADMVKDNDEGIRKIWRQYREDALQAYLPIWSEATLAACLSFLQQELKVRRIFYYTFKAGNCLKRIRRYQPPRSLYEDLPRRFCFQRTHNGPLFLRDSQARPVRNKLQDPRMQWFRFDVQAT